MDWIRRLSVFLLSLCLVTAIPAQQKTAAKKKTAATRTVGSKKKATTTKKFVAGANRLFTERVEHERKVRAA
jgi:hypothetical protein